MGAAGGEASSALATFLQTSSDFAFRCLKKHMGTSGTAASGYLGSAGPDLELPFAIFGTGGR